MTTETRIPDVWTRAMDRAAADHLHAVRVNDRTYVVRSVSHPGTHHLVTLNADGLIVGCSDCPGWKGRQRPCKHAGAVARRILREAQPAPKAEPVSAAVIDSTTRRGQIFRTA